MANKPTPLKLPDGLAQLPRMTFTSRKPPNADALLRSDIAYDVKSSERLVREFAVREGRLRTGK
jgi:hypothetical protein